MNQGRPKLGRPEDPPSVARCKANAELWPVRIRMCFDEAQRWEATKRSFQAQAEAAEKREGYWRTLHRQALAEAANCGAGA